MKRFLYTTKLMLVAVLAFASCTTEDLDPTLAQDKPVEGSINTDQDLYGIAKGMYNRMTSSSYYGRDFIINSEVRTDNVFANSNSGRFTTTASFAYLADSQNGLWTQGYRVIGSANIIIETDLSTIEGDQDYARHLQGQALVVRALTHFNILKNYGQQNFGGAEGIPYIKEFKGDDIYPSREPVSSNVADMMADLDMAFDMMDASYDDSSKQFVTKMTAMAIKSRIAVYFGDWAAAASSASAVINSNQYEIIDADDYVSSFSVDSTPNSIFELAFSDTDNNGSNSLAFIYRGNQYGDIECLDNILTLYEAGDVRADIIGYDPDYAPGDKLRNLGKYPDNLGFDNVNVVRYEEVILNYAEALLNTGGDALSVINQLTAKRGASAYTTLTSDDILNERRKELMFEGFRYDDLIRSGKDIEKIDIQQNFTATIPAGSPILAYPIPQAELDANSNMEQNPGY